MQARAMAGAGIRDHRSDVVRVDAGDEALRDLRGGEQGVRSRALI
jgi:hypothetical protein